VEHALFSCTIISCCHPWGVALSRLVRSHPAPRLAVHCHSRPPSLLTPVSVLCAQPLLTLCVPSRLPHRMLPLSTVQSARIHGARSATRLAHATALDCLIYMLCACMANRRGAPNHSPRPRACCLCHHLQESNRRRRTGIGMNGMRMIQVGLGIRNVLKIRVKWSVQVLISIKIKERICSKRKMYLMTLNRRRTD
jgi:hypothetical protein